MQLFEAVIGLTVCCSLLACSGADTETSAGNGTRDADEGGSAAVRQSVSGPCEAAGTWKDLVPGKVVRYDAATGELQMFGATSWYGGLEGIATWTLNGVIDGTTGDISGHLIETFTGQGPSGGMGTLTFRENITIKATSELDVDGESLSGTGVFEKAKATIVAGGQADAQGVGSGWLRFGFRACP